MSSWKDYLDYYKKKLENGIGNVDIVNLVVRKLSKTDFTVADLLNTGAYKVVRGFCKSGGENSDKLVPLYNKWKVQLLAEQLADHAKPGNVQNNIAAGRGAEPMEVQVNNSSRVFPSQPTEMRNGFGTYVQKNTLNYACNIPNDKSHRNPSPMDEGSFRTKSSTPVQPPVNKFQPFNSVNSSSIVHNVKHNENSTDVKNIADTSDNFDSQSNVSTTFSSPQSSSSQNPLDIGAATTASPNKIGRIPDPYTIEMKEGMFRVVKSSEGLTPDIIRVKRLYNNEDNYDSSSEKDKLEIHKKSQKKGEQSKCEKNSEIGDEKNMEKVSSSKTKNHTPDKVSKHKSSVEKAFIKSEKLKSNSPSCKRAIEKSDKRVKEKHFEVSKSEKNFSPHKVSSKSNIKVSPVVKTNIKGSPNVKINIKGSPNVKINIKSSPTLKSSSDGSHSIKSSTKGSPSVKPSSKGSPPVKSSSKESLSIKSSSKVSPSVFVNNATNSSPCDIKKSHGHKDCDKKPIKVVINHAADNFISSKKERTFVYSGKKTLQDVPKLSAVCVRALKRNIDSIKFTNPVPYETLKPVLQQCSASQLRRLEEYNSYLLKHTDEIWKSLCQRRYRDLKPGSHATWRDFYWKTRDDQEKKLKNITASISASRQKAPPERQVKLTLIDSPERPRSKKVKLCVPEPKDVKISSKESLLQQNLSKESNIPKVPQKDPMPIIHQKTQLKECAPYTHKKAKKAPLAPMMSKVKKTMLAMQKK